MAGITKMTAYIVATRGDDIKTSAAFHKPTGKWVGWITLGPEDRYRPLLDSGPYYSSEEEALIAMKQCVADIREAVEKELGVKQPTGQDVICHVFSEKDDRVFVQPEEKHESQAKDRP